MGSKDDETKVGMDKIYEELGTNYRHFLRWRYAVVLAVGLIDFAAYKVIVESHPTKFLIIICFIVFIAALFSLLSYELRSAEMYRRIIKAAKEIEGRKEGYYTILDRDNDQNDNERL